jgi:urease accessory protein
MQINTGGGIAGGDRIETRYELGPNTDIVHSSSSAERIYRSDGAAAHLAVTLSLEAGARLDWLPQQTILYAGARLERRITIDMAPDSRLLMVEILTFGRADSAEGSDIVGVNDQWRITRGGRLVYAEATRLSGELGGVLSRPAVAGGARASALILLVAPNAADQVDAVRGILEGHGSETGVSAWDGLLAARALSNRAGDLVAMLARTVPVLTGRSLPRVWST